MKIGDGGAVFAQETTDAARAALENFRLPAAPHDLVPLVVAAIFVRSRPGAKEEHLQDCFATYLRQMIASAIAGELDPKDPVTLLPWSSYWASKRLYSKAEFPLPTGGWLLEVEELKAWFAARGIALVFPLEKDSPVTATDDERPATGAGRSGAVSRETLLKLVLGMAMADYKYKAEGQNRQPATGEKAGSICAALDAKGLKIDSETVKKALDEAKALLPKWTK